MIRKIIFKFRIWFTLIRCLPKIKNWNFWIFTVYCQFFGGRKAYRMYMRKKDK